MPSSLSGSTRRTTRSEDHGEIIALNLGAAHNPDLSHPLDDVHLAVIGRSASRAMMVPVGAIVLGANNSHYSSPPSEMEWSSDQIFQNHPVEQPLDKLQGAMTVFRDENNQFEEEEEHQEHRQHQSTRTKKKSLKGQNIVCCCTVVTFIIAAFVLAGILGFRVLNQNENVSVDAQKAKRFQECLADELYASSQLSEIQRLLLQNKSPATTTGGVDSSQRVALCWLSEQDEFFEIPFENESEEDVVQVYQRFALASIYYQTAERLSKSNWLSNVHVCEWEYVNCESLDGVVTELFFKGMHFNGTIPGEICGLSDLVYLRLSQSGLTGTIPVELFKLTKLQVLDLSMNSLTLTIPSEIAGLVEVRHINFSKNLVTGTIPSELFSLKTLDILDLAFNDLTGEIPFEAAKLDQLRTMDLSNNRFIGYISALAFEIPNLQSLTLAKNNLTGSLPNTLSNATSLKKLILGYTLLTGTIPDISKLTNLELLDIQRTLIQQDSFPDVSKLTNLERLIFHQVAIAGTIPSFIWSLPRLKSLSIGRTQLTGTIPSVIGVMTTLERFGISASNISGSIPTELGSLPRLTHLSLRRLPDLSGTFPTELGRLTNLNILELPVVSKISATVPPEICHLLSIFNTKLKRICGPKSPQCRCCSKCPPKNDSE